MDRSLRGRFATSLSEHRHEMPAAAGASFGRAGRRGSDPGGEVDYAEEGRKLLALVNLDVSEHHTTVMRYAPYNAMYKHPSGGGILYVGNEQVRHCRTVAVFNPHPAIQSQGFPRDQYKLF